MMMDKKVNDKDIIIPPGKEIDPDELVHEQEIVPDSNEEQDIDDLVHSIKTPTTIDPNNEEKDIDDLMHEPGNGNDATGPPDGE